MPFQSEKQRRYLWANEPEIARDWTDTYGSGIAKALGGRIGMATGMSPGEAQARGLGAQHHGSVTSGSLHAGNVGGEGGQGFVPGIGTVSAPPPKKTPRGAPDFVTKPWERGFKSISPKLGAQSNWQKFLTKMRGWNEEEDRPNTQAEWEANKAQRIADKRIQKIQDRGIPWTEDTLKNLANLDPQKYGNLTDLQKEQLIGSTPFDRYPPREGTIVEDYAKGITDINQPMYDEMTGNVAQSKQLANELARRDTLQAYEQFTPDKPVIDPSGDVNYASMFPNFKNIGSNVMKGANWLADRASNVIMNQAPNRLFDYYYGKGKPVTDLREIAPTRSTQDVLMQGIASNIARKGYDFSKPFSSVIQSKGGGREHGLDRTVDYGGYKLGNPLKAGMGNEVLQMWDTLFGGSAENQIANTLGDYTVNYNPSTQLGPQVNPEAMNVSDIYDFRGKGGEGWGTPYDINVNLSPQMIGKIKGMNYNQGGLASLWPR